MKRGDAELSLQDADRNHEVTILKKALLITSYPHDLFSVKVATTNGVTVIFTENKNELRYKNGTEFRIH